MKENKINLEKIKVNAVSDGFWVVPNGWNIFSPKQRNFVIKRAKTLEEIIEYNNLFLGNYYFSFNKDHDFKLFNRLQTISQNNIKIDNSLIKEIEKNHKKMFLVDEEANIWILLDEKSLYDIYLGNSFFVDRNYFKNLVLHFKNKNINQEKWVFIWRKKSFELEIAK